jgi:uncharacterized coiled-coil protein SlyX
MEPYEQELFNGDVEKRAVLRRRVVAGLVAVLGIAGIALSYGVHERTQVQELTEQAATAKSETDQLQAQVKALTARLNDMSMAQSASNPPHVAASDTANSKLNLDDLDDNTPPAVAPTTTAPSIATTPTAKPKAPKHTTTTAKRRTPATDKRYTELKAQLDTQEKELKDTQDAVAKNRTDLEGSISSTRDELNGSIAKTHDELVTLEKKGERSYFEFDLTKGKQFDRVGPITLSLRKTDAKHKTYDLTMLVDDNELNKKKVNLYEPVWIHAETDGETVQIVVNRIDKNGVHGYVSAPKYKASELATMNSASPSPAPAVNSVNASQNGQQSPQK